MADSKRYAYTRRMEEMLTDSSAVFFSFYCQEDLENQIRQCRKAAPDRKVFALRELETLCEACHLDYRTVCAHPAEICRLPKRQELIRQLGEMLWTMHQETPSPKNYMERLVRALLPQYSRDSVRLAILKGYIEQAGRSCRHIDVRPYHQYVLEQMDEKWNEQYQKANEAEKTQMVIAELKEDIFTPERLQEKLSNPEILQLILTRLERMKGEQLFDKQGNLVIISGLLWKPETRKHVMESTRLASIFKADSSSRTDSGIADAAAWSNEELLCYCLEHGILLEDEVFSMIRKDFAAQLNSLFYRKEKNGSKSRYTARFKEDLKYAASRKQKWSLLGLVSDLAEGNFYTNGKTRRDLYDFAILMQMQPDAEDPCLDLEKNLFEDYYNDNLALYLKEPSQSSRYENEPAGEGINYKNYVETLYLYYLKRQDLPYNPGERLDQIERMIRKVKEEKKRLDQEKKSPDQMDQSDQTNPSQRTAASSHSSHSSLLWNAEGYDGDHEFPLTSVYQDHLEDSIYDLDEDELVCELAACYEIDPDKAGILSACHQNGAQAAYQEIFEEMEEQKQTSFDYARSLLREQSAGSSKSRKDDTRLAIVEEADQSSLAVSDKLALELKHAHPESTGFCRMMDAIMERVHEESGWYGQKKQKVLLYTARHLIRESSADHPLALKTIAEFLRLHADLQANGDTVNWAAADLQKLGMPLMKVKMGRGISGWYFDHETKLPDQSDLDQDLLEVVEICASRYGFDEEDGLSVLEDLVQEKLNRNIRITRTAFVIAYGNYYLSLLEETPDVISFPDLFDDFSSTINPILEDARFQKLSEKNILDLYVVISIYRYLAENGLER